MFSGIVDHVGIIKEISGTPAGVRLTIDSKFEDLVLGESIAVDGCCLTVEKAEQGSFLVALSSETLGKTFASEYQKGSQVNLERAMRLSDRIGGHMVSGHVDETGQVKTREEKQEFLRFVFHRFAPLNHSYVTKKGSVAVNGVSLTVNEVYPDAFEVMLIPHTLERTNLAHLKENDAVNLEFDWTSKIIVNEVRRILDAGVKL